MYSTWLPRTTKFGTRWSPKTGMPINLSFGPKPGSQERLPLATQPADHLCKHGGLASGRDDDGTKSFIPRRLFRSGRKHSLSKNLHKEINFPM